MRGKERYHFAICEVYGITPAYAGKSAVLKQLQHSHMDHPRVCGEKVIRHPFPIHKRGSPPRMRGKAPLLGFGFTLILDHPRVCGEKCQLYAKPSVSVGSPPRMRGKEAEQAPASEHSRITPAYAGKRRLTVLNCLLLQDHPRVCGEKWIASVPASGFLGSPPRMRGKDPRRSRRDC